MEPLRVGVVEGDEIFRRGMIAVLKEADCESVVLGRAQEASPEALSAGRNIDVAIVSSESLGSVRLSCPIVALTKLEPVRADLRHADPRVMAVLPHEGLRAEELVASVRAAAAGLQVEPPDRDSHDDAVLDPRRVRVLELLAEGADTRAIARTLQISDRMVKTLIRDIQISLGATNRAQAVAEGMRQGLI